MFKRILKITYLAFLTLISISILLAGWTGYSFISQPSKSSEINNLVRNIYKNQGSVFFDVINLSKLLIKDTSETIVIEDDSPSTKIEMDIDHEYSSELDELIDTKDNGANPLRIVIEPSLSDVREESLPDITHESLPEILDEPLLD